MRHDTFQCNFELFRRILGSKFDFMLTISNNSHEHKLKLQEAATELVISSAIDWMAGNVAIEIKYRDHHACDYVYFRTNRVQEKTVVTNHLMFEIYAELASEMPNKNDKNFDKLLLYWKIAMNMRRKLDAK